MKRIYIILTKSPSILSKTISAVTKEPYTHSSISFSNTIQPMYSAGRDYALLPAPGHLKVEPLQSGFYKYYPNCKFGLYYLDVSDQQFEKCQSFVIENVKKRLPFNVLGLLYCNFNIDKPRKDHYFCSEFVATALKQADIDIKKKPNLYHPADFLEIDGIKCLYQGKIKDAINRSFDE